MLLSERVVRPPAKFWDDSWRTTTAHSRNYAASKLHGKPIHHGETRSSYPILTRRSNRRRLDHHNNMGCLGRLYFATWKVGRWCRMSCAQRGFCSSWKSHPDKFHLRRTPTNIWHGTKFSPNKRKVAPAHIWALSTTSAPEGHRHNARISETHKEKPFRDHRAKQQQKRAQAYKGGNPKTTVRETPRTTATKQENHTKKKSTGDDTEEGI